MTDDGDENYEDIDEVEEDEDDNDEREEDSYESGESDLESQPVRIHNDEFEGSEPWSRHHRRNAIDELPPRFGYRMFHHYNNRFTGSDDDQYHHYGLRRHRHLHSDVTPMVERLLE